MCYFSFKSQAFTSPEYINTFGDNNSFTTFINNVKSNNEHVTFSFNLNTPDGHLWKTRYDFICSTNELAALWLEIDGKDASFMLKNGPRKYFDPKDETLEMTMYIKQNYCK